MEERDHAGGNTVARRGGDRRRHYHWPGRANCNARRRQAQAGAGRGGSTKPYCKTVDRTKIVGAASSGSPVEVPVGNLQ